MSTAAASTFRRLRLVDLSHTIQNGLITYKGLPAPIVCDYLSREDSRKHYAPGTEFQIAKIEMVSNTGTYLDCPFHRYAHGKDLSMFPLEAFVDLDGIMVDVSSQESRAIDENVFKGLSLEGKAVLIKTNWSRHWNTDPYFSNEHPHLTESAAKFLEASKVKLVGIDSYNIDDTKQNTRPVHSTLLASDIPIVEHMTNLDQVGKDRFLFTAGPPKFKGVGTFPVRAFAKVDVD
jgi:kynurenine formamidase